MRLDYIGQVSVTERCRPVGKLTKSAFYVHKAYKGYIPDLDALETALKHLPEGTEYEVVKYSYRAGSISFIRSEDFDTASEPTVGASVCIRILPDGEVKVSRRGQGKDPWIYHHKWLFVDDDYTGFDVRESKRRSMSWFYLPNLNRKRIGRKSYWTQEVEPLITRGVTC